MSKYYEEIKAVVWKKTRGKCWYCGIDLVFQTVIPCMGVPRGKNIFTIDHVVPNRDNDLDNLVPACNSCNTSKGTKSLEEFRLRSEIGISFSKIQVEYLLSFGIKIPRKKNIVFYGETL